MTNDLHDTQAATSLRQRDGEVRLVGDTRAGGSVLEFYLPAGTPRPRRIARGQGTRWKVISREPSYHGATLGAQGATGDGGAEALFGPMMHVSPKVPAPLSYRVPEGTTVAEHAAACACALEARILAEGADTVLAFIMEPVGGVATGALVAPEAYYQEVRRICSCHAVLLIHDEVMSGAGRTGRFLASQHFADARPDIVTLAKGLAAGYTPFGAVLAGGEIVDTIARAGGFAHGHTYVANPYSCAVARAVLETVVDERLVERAAELGERLRQRLLDLQSRVALIGDVRGLGLLQAIELVGDRTTRRALPVAINAPARLSAHGIENGLALITSRTKKS